MVSTNTKATDLNVKPLYICSFLPCIHTEVGHLSSYHRAFGEAVRKLGWHHEAWMTRDADLDEPPPTWRRVLSNDFWDGSKPLWKRLILAFKNLKFLRREFKCMESHHVLFLDHGYHHLLPIAFLLIFMQPSFQLWILHRHPERGLKKLIFRLLYSFLKKHLALQLFSDSELLAKEIDAITLPIPHTFKPVMPRVRNKSLQLWWPGSSIREERGVKILGKIAGHLKPSHELLIAEDAAPFVALHDQIHLLNSPLHRDEYEKIMQNVDVVLLPYEKKRYSHATSGIFVEAIVSGAMPLVTKGTWMAWQLEKYDLGELALSWDQLSFLENLEELLEMTKGRRQEMQKAYSAFHSIENLSSILESAHLKHGIGRDHLTDSLVEADERLPTEPF